MIVVPHFPLLLVVLFALCGAGLAAPIAAGNPSDAVIITRDSFETAASVKTPFSSDLPELLTLSDEPKPEGPKTAEFQSTYSMFPAMAGIVGILNCLRHCLCCCCCAGKKRSARNDADAVELNETEVGKNLDPEPNVPMTIQRPEPAAVPATFRHTPNGKDFGPAPKAQYTPEIRVPDASEAAPPPYQTDAPKASSSQKS